MNFAENALVQAQRELPSVFSCMWFLAMMIYEYHCVSATHVLDVRGRHAHGFHISHNSFGKAFASQPRTGTRQRTSYCVQSSGIVTACATTLSDRFHWTAVMVARLLSR